MSPARQVHQQRDKRQLVIGMHIVLGKVAVLAQHVAVIRGHDDQRVLHAALPLQLIQQTTKPSIGHGQASRILPTDMPQGVRVQICGGIVGPDELRAIPIVPVHLQVLPGAVKGLMRIKGLHHQEPVVTLAIAPHPIDGRLEGTRAGEIFLPLKGGAVASVFLAPAPQVGRLLGRLDDGDPFVVLLPAKELPGIKGAVIVLPAHLEIVIVIRHQVGKDAVLGKGLGKAAIKGLDASPAALEEVQPAGEDIAPGGHAGGRADDVPIKAHAALGKALEMRRDHPVVAINRQKMPVQAIHQHQYSLHGLSFPTLSEGNGPRGSHSPRPGCHAILRCFGSRPTIGTTDTATRV